MLDIVKKRLRLKTASFDDDVEALIEEARSDLELTGILQEKAQSEDDPLIRRAVCFYCLAHFGKENPGAERYLRAYEGLRDKLSLTGEYNGRLE